jgi:REP element-mobilizing transposase RayT
MSVPGATYLVTRTTVMSMFLLAPCAEVNRIMEYSIAWAARGRGVLLHAVSVESNHFHIVLTDPDEKLSEFMRELNRCAARALLQYYRKRFPRRRFDSIWASGQSFSSVVLVTPEAILDAIVYTLTNPVKDAQVRDYRKWDGFHTRPGHWRSNVLQTVARPAYFFKNTPTTLDYRVVAPQQLNTHVEPLVKSVEQLIRDKQQEIAATLRAEHRSVVGANDDIAKRPLDAPSTPRPIKHLNPTLAAGGNSRALEIAKQAIKLFRCAYRAAWKAFKAGERVVFPGGTLLMRLRFGQRCEPLDACWCVRAVSAAAAAGSS